ncbi:MAG TPA: hypothetical protein VJO72_03795 [Candidatus Dormibacteraeota bacterium]|nr:hypothetical protein [Candidatus Dormibacteraeota bacterium]
MASDTSYERELGRWSAAAAPAALGNSQVGETYERVCSHRRRPGLESPES